MFYPYPQRIYNKTGRDKNIFLSGYMLFLSGQNPYSRI